MKLHFSIFFLALIACVGCKKDSNASYAYFGGEIINAVDDYIILSKDNTVIDTIKLDGNNRFIYKIKKLQTGFHTFRHGAEIQIVLLEPHDSIMFRLNTYEFDESLVFTGIGAKKNNYFIEEYLQNKTEQKRIFKYCQLDSKIFSNRIDSIRAHKNQKLNKFQKKHSPSDLFISIAQANIDYNYYTRKEIYPFIHYGKNKSELIKSLPKDFYAYRKNADYKNDFNKSDFVHNNFIKSNLNNLALEKHIKHNEAKNFSRKSICFNIDKLDLIDSLIKTPAIKNKMLFKSTYDYLSKNENVKNNEAIVNSFLQKSTNEKNNTKIKSLVLILDQLKTGNTFPDITVFDLKNKQTEINNIVKKPTAVYFWSHNFYNHFKDSHKKVKELRNKYPEIDFIAINIDNKKPDTWLTSIQNNRFSLNKEYRFTEPKKASKTLAIYPMTKVFVIDKDKKIVHSNTNLFTLKFEEQLLGLISK